MTDLTKTLEYLRSLWGALAAMTVLFPPTAYLLKLTLVSDSVLAGVYTGFGTLFSILALLIVVTFRESFFSASSARKVAIPTFILAIVLSTSFVGVKTSLVIDSRRSEYVRRGENLAERVIETSSGGDIRTSNSTSNDDASSSDKVVDESRSTNPFEALAAALFVATSVSLTVCFTSLGMFYYNQSLAGQAAPSQISVS